jgi:GNAT superfamily N-acetyltransferase
LHRLTHRDHAPGVLAYQDGAPVGWCSIGPREEFAALKVPRSLKQVDGQPVWSIVCFYVAQTARRSGLMAALLRGAVAYARQQGARIIEGYPVDMQTPLDVRQEADRLLRLHGPGLGLPRRGLCRDRPGVGDAVDHALYDGRAWA